MRTIVLTEKQSKFVREVGSVVLGVLIALAIGEVAEAVRWKFRVENSMEAMRKELGENRYYFVERAAYQNCMTQRLTDIGRVLGEARRTGILPDVDDVGRPSLRPIQSAAFDVAKSEGISLHMNRQQARDVAYVYASVDYYRTFVLKEDDSWHTLQLLQNAPGPVDAELLTAMSIAWADASEHNRLIGFIVQQQDEGLEKLGVAVPYKPAIPNLTALTKVVRLRPLCAPMR